jgi:hypothetical protein
MLESHHVSRHFEKRRRQTARQAGKKQRTARQKQYDANRRRAAVNRRLPKLSMAVHASSHLILSAKATTGLGADHAHFPLLLLNAAERMALETVLADAGYDSEDNHRLARDELKIRSLIPATCGRPGAEGPSGHYRRLMQTRFKSGPDKRFYGQRWQAETVNSMIKRNLGSACRARTPAGRKRDMLLRAVTHNLMIVANL